MSLYPDEDTIGSPRLLWYNPKLDPTLSHKMTPAMIKAINDGTYDDGTVEQGGPLNTPDEWHEANLVSSLCADGLHRPTLDIDITYKPSNVQCIYNFLRERHDSPIVLASVSGNCHVYCIGPALTWPVYVARLIGLASHGWLEDRYVAHSVNRGQTLLRLPGVPKLAAYTAGDITTAVDNDGRLVFNQ